MKLLQFLLLALLISFISCEKDKMDENELEDVDVILRLEDDSTIHFCLEFRTQKQYPCVGYPILSDINNLADQFTIHLREVGTAPEVCRTAFGPASGTWKFPYLENGEYPISIKISDDDANKGKLIVADRKFEILMETQEEIHFPNGNVLNY